MNQPMVGTLRNIRFSFTGTDMISKCSVDTMAGRKSLCQSSKIEGPIIWRESPCDGEVCLGYLRRRVVAQV